MQAFASQSIAMLTFQFKHIKIAYQACMQIAEQNRKSASLYQKIHIKITAESKQVKFKTDRMQGVVANVSKVI